MDNLQTEGSAALEVLIEAATLDGYANGYWSADKALADRKADLDRIMEHWNAVNPDYVAWPDCVHGLARLAVNDRDGYRHLVGSIAGENPETYEGLCGMLDFLKTIVDDHDYTIDPRDPSGPTITFNGPIGEGGVVGVSPRRFREALSDVELRKDYGTAPKGF